MRHAIPFRTESNGGPAIATGGGMTPEAAEILSVIGQVVQWGVLGFTTLALMFGLLVAPWVYKAKKEESDAWKKLYLDEREAHQRTRDAYALQGERMQVAVEAARIQEQFLREAHGRVVPQAPAG